MAKTGNTLGFSMRRLAFCKKGQLLLPAIIMLPTMWILVMLLLETAKLSRAKIKQQLAVDVASTIEMENYSDYFNRTAYANGAFPYRIFAEQYEQNSPPTVQSSDDLRYGGNTVAMKDMFLANGLYPTWMESAARQVEKLSETDLNAEQADADKKKVWPIVFTGVHGIGADSYNGGNSAVNDNLCPSDALDWNTVNPSLPNFGYFFRNHNCFIGTPAPFKCTYRSDHGEAQADRPCGVYDMSHIYADMTVVQAQFKFWFTAYTLLGQVSKTQTEVFKSLTDGTVKNQFFRKAIMLNVGECAEDGGEQSCGETGLTKGVDNAVDTIASMSGLAFDEKVIDSGNFKTYYALFDKNTPLYQLPVIKAHRWDYSGQFSNLFQFRSPTQAQAAKLETMGKKGLGVSQKWIAESNFFNVNVNDDIASNLGMDDGLRVRNVVYVRTSTCNGTAGCGEEAAFSPGSYINNGVKGTNNTVWPAPTPKYLVVLDP